VHEAPHTGRHCRLGGDAGAVDVHLPESAARLGERHQRHVVVHDVDARHGARDAGAIADVALDVLDVGGHGRIAPHVEDAHLLAARAQPARDQMAQEA
jgi:hypothetical protein